jgi:hypothetical protein
MNIKIHFYYKMPVSSCEFMKKQEIIKDYVTSKSIKACKYTFMKI